MTIRQLAARLVVFLIVIWAAASLIFILPHLAPGRNPVRERLGQQAAGGGGRALGIEEVVAAFEREFGLDKPLWRQYVVFLGNTAQLDFGVSLALYPTKVSTLIWQALPWTLGLVGVSTLLAFVIGSLAGALLAWPGVPRFVHFIFPPLMVLSAVPYFLLGIALLFIFAFKWSWFPIGGGSPLTSFPEWSLAYVWQIVYHAVLPASAITLSGIGFWALGMRGMMVTIANEDYISLAEMRGLRPRRVFLQYGLRNALLPQITALGLALGFIVSGIILVEFIFRYPGIGSLLFKAISAFDYFLIYGVVFILIVGIALSTLVLDFIYPLLDPRIRYSKS
ncbi:MAG: ABC transporter permease [Chloroflexi bacterium]|nr:ABC transporter permease [Chloroflexota bacterium]